MYQPDTILKLKEPRGEDFPYDRVRVVGQSPVNHADISSEWVGTHGQGVIVEPLSAFGSNLDEPFGRLQELYEVESIPEPVDIEVRQTVRVVKAEDAGQSPEEVFANEAADDGKDARRAKPVRQKPSPLVETPPDPEAEKEKERIRREALRRAGRKEATDDGEASDQD